MNSGHENRKKKKKQTLIREKTAAAKPKVFVFKKIAFFKKVMAFKIMLTPKKTYDDEKKKPLLKKTAVKKQLTNNKLFSKKKPAFKRKTVMSKLIKIIVFILTSFSALIPVLERESLILELSVPSSLPKESVGKKRRVATSKKNDFVPMMHGANQGSVINEDFLIGLSDFEIRKILFKNKRVFSFVMTC